MIPDLLFYCCSGFLLGGIGGVFWGENRVKNVLWLIFSFFQAALLMIVLGAEFMAMLLLIIYVGAVAVLFLFIVMMHDRISLHQTSFQGLSWSLGGVLFCEVFFFLWGEKKFYTASLEGERIGSAQAIGQLMYGNESEMIYISGLILLLAMIGTIVLILRHKRRKTQHISDQVATRPLDSVHLTTPAIGKGLEDSLSESIP